MTRYFKDNIERDIVYAIGKKPILITGKTGSGKSSLTKYLRERYGEFEFVPEISFNFNGNLTDVIKSKAIVSEVQIKTLYKLLMSQTTEPVMDTNKNFLGVHCYKTKDGKYHVKELRLTELKQDDIYEH